MPWRPASMKRRYAERVGQHSRRGLNLQLVQCRPLFADVECVEWNCCRHDSSVMLTINEYYMACVPLPCCHIDAGVRHEGGVD